MDSWMWGAMNGTIVREASAKEFITIEESTMLLTILLYFALFIFII